MTHMNMYIGGANQGQLALAKEQYPDIDTLSMGMSQDYKLAVKHGSNTVRIGHAIFE